MNYNHYLAERSKVKELKKENDILLNKVYLSSYDDLNIIFNNNIVQ